MPFPAPFSEKLIRGYIIGLFLHENEMLAGRFPPGSISALLTIVCTALKNNIKQNKKASP
jgi:hypothetical protein